MIGKQFEELKHTGQLPSPSGVGMKILSLSQDEDCPLDELVQAIQADPALTGRILKLASSALVTGQAPVTDVKEAAMRLGIRAVSSVALGFSLVAANRTGACSAFDYEGYWSHSLGLGVAAQYTSRALHLGDPAEAFTLGLLSRVGELALASVHPKAYADILVAARRSSREELRSLEAEAFSIDHVETSAAMLTEWGLPEHFAAAIETDPDLWEALDASESKSATLARLLVIGRALADYCVAEGEARFACLDRFHELGRQEGLSEKELDVLGAEVAAAWKDWGGILQVSTSEVPEMATLRSTRTTRMTPIAQPPVDPGNARMRVLAVDDDPVALRLLARHLEKAGNEVVTASNGKAALAVALEFEPHIVVTDWMMPEMDGLQLCKALRLYPSGRKKYILLLTGRAEEERVVEAFDAGADDYIVKPFKPKLLIARIRAGRRVVLLQEQVEHEKRLQREQMAKLGVMTRKLREAAMTDPLTELPNRRFAMRRLDTEWATHERSERSLAVLAIDIDHFKQVNDDHGHDVGDVVLQRVSGVLKRSVRRGDTVARMGGEEFLVICPDTDTERALQVAERIRVSVEAELIECGTFRGSRTVSCGVAVSSAGVVGKDQLLKIADEALYRAKGAGRNRVDLGEHPGGRSRSA